MSLPSGTVTFFFTDIEGSTRLWEEHPQAMRTALARHDALLRQVIEDNAGVVFKTMGDAFCAAFATAPEALAAALTAQVALYTESWPDALMLRVRMALHTGTAELRDGDYFGQTLNRIARLLAIGHGGQVLVSTAAQELTRDNLPATASLKAVGDHRLRDLGRPEAVFQLLHPDLSSEFPPLKSLDNPDLPNNLPVQVTSFIGRAKEIEAVKTLLDKTRLLTLTGSGGCGKTRLAMQVAADVLENYPDGVWLIELAPLADPALVPQAVAFALGVREEAGKPLVQTLVDLLKAKRLLVVLDNCEHLLNASAQLVDTLIRACPHLRVLASSREGLGIAGELTYRIPSLSLPDPKQTVTVESMNQYEAVQLFIERALFHLPTFAITSANAPALASICHRLDGIPLALELSAARVRSLSVEEINSRLDNRFRLLTGGSRTALPRQQTLRALIDWSYNLLNDQEKALLCRLSVFAGGWILQAAEAVGTGTEVEEWEILDLLTSLVDKSLVVAEAKHEQTRHRLLETVRQYARERLVESGEGEGIREQHQAFFLTFAEAADPLLAGPEQAVWLDRLEHEHDNLRAALEWDNKEAALRIAGALYRFWDVRGYYTEGRKWLADTLASPIAQAHSPARAKALAAAGGLAYSQGDYTAAKALHEHGLTLYRELGDKQGIANSLNSQGLVSRVRGDYVAAQVQQEQSLILRRELEDKNGIATSLLNLGTVAYEQGDHVAARSLYTQSLAQCQELGNKRGLANSLNNLGTVAYGQSDYAAAYSFYAQGLAQFQELGDKSGAANCLGNLGLVAHEQGDYAAAQALHEQSLTLNRDLGNKDGIATSLLNLGAVAYEQGDYVATLSLLKNSLALSWEVGDKRGIAYLLDGFAALALRQEQTERAPLLWGAAEALREAVGSPLLPSERIHYDQRVAQAHSAMEEDVFAGAWMQGRTMTIEQAIEYVME